MVLLDSISYHFMCRQLDNVINGIYIYIYIWIIILVSTTCMAFTDVWDI